ncbi:hypothetical protein C0584_06230 [Candidatus Parcubacteria bacterium]|nr:MAG: hypothetical protein C0584_06230 [Candidatus Parcubacteria bacterium]
MMNLEKFFENIDHTPKKFLRRNFDDLLRYKSKYKNLDKGNQDVIFGVIEKYVEKLKKYHRIDSNTIRLEMNKLRRNRIKLDMTEEDLKDTEEILKMFKG